MGADRRHAASSLSRIRREPTGEKDELEMKWNSSLGVLLALVGLSSQVVATTALHCEGIFISATQTLSCIGNCSTTCMEFSGPVSPDPGDPPLDSKWCACRGTSGEPECCTLYMGWEPAIPPSGGWLIWSSGDCDTPNCPADESTCGTSWIVPIGDPVDGRAVCDEYGF